MKGRLDSTQGAIGQYSENQRKLINNNINNMETSLNQLNNKIDSLRAKLI